MAVEIEEASDVKGKLAPAALLDPSCCFALLCFNDPGATRAAMGWCTVCVRQKGWQAHNFSFSFRERRRPYSRCPGRRPVRGW